ncbi:DNA mismatch repair protein Msh3 [Bagarius yarrelli]|uniref:DNA mismatch repair protein MSH3 n=1 Tax=Bagarius yarrelli TaxID=175774 RepID=A0A556U5I1_BAGYA|nr:DNA mismatch repair protein Msh3 [Bagarius yarrelli]
MSSNIRRLSASKARVKSSTQTTISRFFSSAADGDAAVDEPRMNCAAVRQENRGKKRLSFPGESGSLKKRLKLSDDVKNLEQEQQEEEEKQASRTKADGQKPASKPSLASSTLKKLRGYSCHTDSENPAACQQVKMEGSGDEKPDNTLKDQVKMVEETEEELGHQSKQMINFGQFAKTGGVSGSKRSPPDPAGLNRRTKSVYTPLEQQYMEIKEQYKDTILCVECGYKYRFFGEDAEIAAKELNIFCHLDHNFMTASIPTHRLFVHVRRLVSQGYKVGVVKQTETSAIKASSANKSSLFTRQLSALYTKSTLVGEDVNPLLKPEDLEQAEDVVQDTASSYLMCVSESWEKHSKDLTVALVVVQPSIGDVMVDCFKDNASRSELEARVLRIQPVEILIPSNLSETTERLLRTIALASSFKRLSSDAEHMVLSATTLKNLEIFCNQTTGSVKGSLLWVLDHTRTPFGKRLLKKWVSQPLNSTSEILLRQEAVAEILSSESAVLPSIQTLLTRLPDLEKGLCSIYHKKCSTQEFYLICSTLSRLGAELQALIPAVQSQLSSALLKSLLLDTPHLLSSAQSFLKVLNEKAAKTGNKTELFEDLTDFPLVKERKDEIEAVRLEVMKHRQELRIVLRNPSLDYATVSGQEGVCVCAVCRPEVLELEGHVVIREGRHPVINMLMAEQDQYVPNDTDLQGEGKRAMIITGPNMGGERAHIFARPEVLELEGHVVIREGRHPVINMLMAEQDQYVPNDTDLQGEGKRAMIITGPNMGGKSSYIRQVALLTIMAQLGSFVPAREASFGIVDGIFTRARNFSKICQSGYVYCLVWERRNRDHCPLSELVSRWVTENAGARVGHCCNVNADERCMKVQSSASINPFAVRCLTLFVTHYPPLCELENLYPCHVGNYHMAFLLNEPETAAEEEEVQPEFITFLFQLTEGAAARSYGLNVARLAEIPQSILTSAAHKSKELEAIVNSRRMIKLSECKSNRCSEELNQNISYWLHQHTLLSIDHYHFTGYVGHWDESSSLLQLLPSRLSIKIEARNRSDVSE